MGELLQIVIVSVVALGGLVVVYRSVFARGDEAGAGTSCPKCTAGDPCDPGTSTRR